MGKKSKKVAVVAVEAAPAVEATTEPEAAVVEAEAAPTTEPEAAAAEVAPVVEAPAKKAPKAPKVAKEVKEKRGGTHPKHPRCPACGKSMFKSATSKPVKTTDPWVFCRNEKCPLFGNQTDYTAEQITDATVAFMAGKGKPKAASPAPADTDTGDGASEPTVETGEGVEVAAEPTAVAPEQPKKGKAKGKPKANGKKDNGDAAELEDGVIKKASGRIEKAIEQNGPYSHNICSLALSMVSKELGAAQANALIEKYKLTELFKINPVEA